MNPEEVLYKYPSQAATSRYWHRERDGKTVCTGAVLFNRPGGEVQSIKIRDMSDEQLSRICSNCLRKRGEEGKEAGMSIYAAIREHGYGNPYPKRPLCPYCSKQYFDASGRDNRLKWWPEGRKWKCFGCGRLYQPNAIELTASTEPE